MSFGVGVGDIIQLARISSRLSNSFSSGPTGAASEFNEIKSQLSSLGIVLEALAREIGKPGRNTQDARNKEKLGEMVEGCKSSLRRLESIVEKYTDRLDSSWSWKLWFSKGYKIILWTTDGGDIRALKDDLHRHYVMIDAYINVLNRADLQQALTVLDHMLAENRQRRSLSIHGPHRRDSVLRPDATHISTSSRPKTFEGFPPFFATSEFGYKKTAKVKMNFSISRRNPMASICREATVNPDFFLGGSIISNQPMFCCNCSRLSMKGVFQDAHHGPLAKIKCGPGTIIVKNESSDLMQREYTLYAPRIEDPEAKKGDDNFDERPYIISIPLRKNQRAFEASLVTFLAHQAARCLADGIIPESKWVRWENDITGVASQSARNGDLWIDSKPSHRPPQNKPTRGRVLVAACVRLGISAETTIKSLNIRYLPPNNSNWSDGMPVKTLMIIQYRSIRKQKLYLEEDDPDAWQDGDYLKLYLEFAKLSEYIKQTKSLWCDFVWEEKIRIMGPAVTFRVKDLRHFEDGVPVEGTGTLTYLGERISITAGAGAGDIQLDKWNLPKLPPNRKAATNESVFLVQWTQPLHEQLRNFWAARISRKEEIKATFNLNNVAVKGRPDIFHQEFYSSQLVVLHNPWAKTTRLVIRSISGLCVITQNVSDRRWTKMDINADMLSIEEPMANVTHLIPGREKDGPCLKIRQEPNTMIYQFCIEQDAVACICMITELARGEFVTETMALEDAMVGPISGISTPALSETTTDRTSTPELPYQSPRSSSSFLAELPSNHVRKISSGQGPPVDQSKGYELDIEIYLDEARQVVLCPHASVNPALFLSFDAIGPAALPLFACRCKTGKTPQSILKTHELTEYRAGGFTLPILALSSRTSRSPGCFVLVNVIARESNLELYIRCPTPQMERRFEEVMSNLLQTRVATNLAIVGMRAPQELISVYTEDMDTISILSAFGNIEMSPSAEIRIDGVWRFLSKTTKEVSISQHKIVRRKGLAERLSQDSVNPGNILEDSERSKLQFKSGERSFTCYIRKAPKLHPQHSYTTLTMEVEDAVLSPPDNAIGIDAIEERLGVGRLRLRFEGGGRMVQQAASQSFAWFNFWRNRIKMNRWFGTEEDEKREYGSAVEEVAVDTDNSSFFDGFFNNSKLAILRDSELNTMRIYVQSFSNDRILSQEIMPSYFTKERNVRLAVEACCTGEKTFTLEYGAAIADRSGTGEPHCWRISGATSYMFPTRQLRDLFCDSLARIVSSAGEGTGEIEDGVFELDSASGISPAAVELPTFEYSMPTLLRRATINHKIAVDAEENDDESDPEPEPPLPEMPSQFLQGPILSLPDPGKSVRPSRSFVRERQPSPARSFIRDHRQPSPARNFIRERRPSPAPSAEPSNRRSRPPSPKPTLFIPPPPPLPTFPDELNASPVAIRPQQKLLSNPTTPVPPVPISDDRQSVLPSSPTESGPPLPPRPNGRSRSPSRSMNATYRVWAQYDATKDGEINVKVGDMIRVDHEEEAANAVWGVKMQSKPRVEGWVPKWCLTQVGNLDFNLRGRRRA